MNKSSKRRILLTIPTVTSYHTFLKDLIAALIGNGWDTHLASSMEPIRGFDSYKEDVIGEAHHISFARGANPITHFRSALELRNLVAEINPQLIHCHFGVTAFTAALARQSRWPRTIATVQGLTFPQSYGLGKLLFMVCESWSQRRLDGTWVLTQSDVDAFKTMGIPNKVFLQNSKGFGCRLDLFDRSRYSEHELRELQRSLGILPEDFVFIFVGRQVNFKGFAVLVRAFMSIANDCPRVKLLLVGERDPLHPTGLSTLEERSAHETPNIISVGWVGDVAKYLALAHINVFPSRREGMPVNLMESLAMGIPVITSDSRGCRDVVTNNVDGLLVGEPTPRSIAAAMCSLMQNSGQRLQFSQNALAGRVRFDRAAWISEQIAIYNRFMNQTISKETVAA